MAEDVRSYGKWMRDEAERRIAHLYPKIEITQAMVDDPENPRPDLKKYVGQKLIVIAWLWKRTVKSPNPAVADVDVPLASTFMLSTKAGKEAYVEPVIESDGYRFTVKVGRPQDAEGAKNGTKLSRANFACLMSDAPVTGDYIKFEGKAGRMGARLMAIVAEGERERVYFAPTPEMEAIALTASPTWKPEGDIPTHMTGGNCTPYGPSTWGGIFTARQLVALTALSELVEEAQQRVKCDDIKAVSPVDSNGLGKDVSSVEVYAQAVATYLGISTDRLARISHKAVETGPPLEA